MNTARGKNSFQWKQWLAALAATSPMLSIHVDVVWCTDVDFLEKMKLWFLIRPIFIIIGAVIAAVIADIFGRKRSLIVMSIFVIPAVVLILIFVYFELPTLIIAPLIPFGSGVICLLVALYLSEISRTKNCGNLMALQLSVQCFRLFAIWTPRVNNSRSEAQFITCITLFVIAMLFHAITMCVCPETPQYLYWKKRYQEVGKSSVFFNGIHQTGLRQDPSNPRINQKVNSNRAEQGCCERIREIFKFENRRNLAIIFSLIVIRRASGQEQNFMLMINMIERHGFYTGSTSPVPLIGYCILTFIFSIVVTSMVNFLARKLSLLFVIGVHFIFTIMGIVRIESYWAIFGVIYGQYLCQTIVIAVTLAYIGKFFRINIRAMAIALVIIFEVLTRSFFSFVYSSHFLNVSYVGFMSFLAYLKCGVVLASFIFVVIFFPKTKKVSHGTFANEERLPVQELLPVNALNARATETPL